MTEKQKLKVRSKPTQQRSQQRIQTILDVTSTLLEKLGLEGLTTIRIAEASGISVGSVYHYFPNKHAILAAMGEHFIENTRTTLQQMEQWQLDSISLDEFADLTVELQLSVYRGQKGLLHLIQALFSMPELHHLDELHDTTVIEHMMHMFDRLGLKTENEDDKERLGRAWHELTHGLMLTVVLQTPERSAKTLSDLKRMATCLLTAYR
jgi:AcrR family transcriptional regulator